MVNIDWSILPAHFEYLRPFAERYCPYEGTVQEYESFVNRKDPTFMESAEKLYGDIQVRGDAARLSVWIDSISRDRTVRFGYTCARPLFDLFLVFRLLADLGIEPFTTRAVQYDVPEDLDWEKLPRKLRYLAPYAARYGGFQFEDALCQAADTMDDDAKNELARLSERIKLSGHVDELFDWSESNVGMPEREYVAYLIELLDRLGFSIEEV